MTEDDTDNQIGISDAVRRSDIAWTLITEFSQWYGRLRTRGQVPRAFSGIAVAGRQVVVALDGLPFDHVQRREFIIWLCREESMFAYVYGTHVVSAAQNEEPKEALALYASSPYLDVDVSFSLQRDAQGGIEYQASDANVVEAGTVSRIFLGLQRSGHVISDEAARGYSEIWGVLKSRSMWRDAPVSLH